MAPPERPGTSSAGQTNNPPGGSAEHLERHSLLAPKMNRVFNSIFLPVDLPPSLESDPRKTHQAVLEFLQTFLAQGSIGKEGTITGIKTTSFSFDVRKSLETLLADACGTGFAQAAAAAKTLTPLLEASFREVDAFDSTLRRFVALHSDLSDINGLFDHSSGGEDQQESTAQARAQKHM